jgi:hypothetical protein
MGSESAVDRVQPALGPLVGMLGSVNGDLDQERAKA